MMKTAIRMKTSLLEEMEAKLNIQIEMEGKSSQFYLAAASWCEKDGYLNASNFLYQHAEEERAHMLKIFRYVNEVGGHALAPEISGLRYHYNSLREVFELILEHEIKVTRSINEKVSFAFQNQDFATFNFLQWFVGEQAEEEALARRVIEIFDLIGEDSPQGLYHIDNELGKLAAEIAAVEASEEA